MSPRVDDLGKLIRLHTAGDMDEAACQAAAKTLDTLRDDPDFAFLGELGWDDAACIEAALPSVIPDFTAVSDKIDELHEQLENQFDGLPAFPHTLPKTSVDAYFRWLDDCLAGFRPQDGGMRLVRTVHGLDDNIVAAVVLREDVAELMAVANRLGVELALTPSDD